MNFSDELIEKARAAKTPEELITMAKALNIELTSEQASEYFTRLNPKSGEVSDDELENVSGGECHPESRGMIVPGSHSCSYHKCKNCGKEVGAKEGVGHIGGCCLCGKEIVCRECAHTKEHNGFFLCNEPHNTRDDKK